MTKCEKIINALKALSVQCKSLQKQVSADASSTWRVRRINTVEEDLQKLTTKLDHIHSTAYDAHAQEEVKVDDYEKAYMAVCEECAAIQNLLDGLSARIKWKEEEATRQQNEREEAARLKAQKEAERQAKFQPPEDPCNRTHTNQLPVIKLQPFSGDLNKWLQFKDMFVTLVHEDTNIPEIMKLQYLVSSLTGSAADVVNSIPIRKENYQIAWDLVTARYEQVRTLLFSQLRRFFSQPTIPSESASALCTLLDTSTECMEQIKLLGEPVDSWGSILVYVISEKLDPDSRRQWVLGLNEKEIPKYSQLKEFINSRASALASLDPTPSTSKSSSNKVQPPQTSKTKNTGSSKSTTSSLHTSSSSHHTTICAFCKGDHYHFRCEKFIGMKLAARKAAVQEHQLCWNCLRKGHVAAHFHFSRTTQGEHSYSQSNQPLSLIHSSFAAKSRNGEIHHFRAFIDTGSTCSLVTERCVQLLQLPKRKTNVEITGISSTNAGTATHSVALSILPNLYVHAFIRPSITGNLPSTAVPYVSSPHLTGLQLADPTFYKPGRIDILLGSDICWDILLPDRRVGAPRTLTAWQSVFGWLLVGRQQPSDSGPSEICHYATIDLQAAVQRFWEVDAVPIASLLTEVEKACEDHFHSAHIRLPCGRYQVELPFRATSPLGNSKDQAVYRFKSLERKLSKNPELRSQYLQFMKEYEELGHMERVNPAELPLDPAATYYLPHHPVLKPGSTTTKLRVVFDASAVTSTGLSLNNRLLVGPKVQQDLIQILLRFRTHQIAFSADIAKMYRQVLVHPEHRNYQLILWRESPDDPLNTFRLRTVTYGTASAPYLATKVLQQLSQDEKSQHPDASIITARDFYVDDLMSGAETPTEALRIQQDLMQMLNSAGLELRKWSSNCPAVINAVPPEYREVTNTLPIETDDTVKTLGLSWHPSLDTFSFCVHIPAHSLHTKRSVLSDLARVFDPLGWLTPTTVCAKVLLQLLWQLKVGWDDPIPAQLLVEWKTYQQQLPMLETISIPRRIVPAGSMSFELHGFSDASEKAYAACVNLRTIKTDGSIKAYLVAAKSKVAPLNQESVPRLELCGFVLLVRLMAVVSDSLNLPITLLHGWSDSTVVLLWLSMDLVRLKTFVANRVSVVRQFFTTGNWHHVPGEENPADCASRGILASELRSHPLWWEGPAWLSSQDIPYERSAATLANATSSIPNCVTVEQKIHVISDSPHPLAYLLTKCSKLQTVKSVTAYVFRFINSVKYKGIQEYCGYPSASEQKEAMKYWLKTAQKDEFTSAIVSLQTTTSSELKSKNLQSLNPFLDEEGILRVGGRLRHSFLTPDQRNPILLPQKHRLTYLIIVDLHIKLGHASAQSLLSNLQEQYWIINGRDVVLQVIRKCVRCCRLRATTATQMMADLPSARVNPARPFLKCGVDYAGPINLRVVKGRGRQLTTFKGYISVFVCFVTRAIHLELVSELTTESFIAALRRVVGRRGKPSHMFSDCGTNFVGADHEFKEIAALITSKKFNSSVAEFLPTEGITWSFNPPASPHFGKLWEAGVKSTKYHLRRIVGSHTLNFEEMVTVLAQIEAILNSRPLCQLSSDPNDLQALTPGHFLTGAPLTSLMEPDLSDVPVNHLSRWQLLQRIHQHFWRRWSSEYLSRLQQRPKCLKPKKDLEVNELVLIKQENTSPLKWKMSRIVAVHPGADSKVRVVTVKTESGEIKRPIVKLCPLPIDTE